MSGASSMTKSKKVKKNISNKYSFQQMVLRFADIINNKLFKKKINNDIWYSISS